MCYNATMRAGKTKTTSFSLDARTMRNLKALAKRTHKGNVSAFLAEMAEREAKLLAAEAFFEKYGFARLSDSDVADIENDWVHIMQALRKKSRAA